MTEYNKLKVPELKKLCRERGYKTSGSKQYLVDILKYEGKTPMSDDYYTLLKLNAIELLYILDNCNLDTELVSPILMVSCILETKTVYKEHLDSILNKKKIRRNKIKTTKARETKARETKARETKARETKTDKTISDNGKTHISDYNSYSLCKLKKECKRFVLPQTGNKKQIIKRILTHKNIPKKKLCDCIPNIFIIRNKYGRYEHVDTGYIVNTKTKQFIGKQCKTTSALLPLTVDDVPLLMKYKSEYNINHDYIVGEYINNDSSIIENNFIDNEIDRLIQTIST
mgnify:CR=1 FL=1